MRDRERERGCAREVSGEEIAGSERERIRSEMHSVKSLAERVIARREGDRNESERGGQTEREVISAS